MGEKVENKKIDGWKREQECENLFKRSQLADKEVGRMKPAAKAATRQRIGKLKNMSNMKIKKMKD